MGNKFAQLTNVIKFNNLLMHVAHGDPSLPSIGCFYGASGLGKTTSAVFGANMHGAKYLSVGASWTRKRLVSEIAKQHGLLSIKTVVDGMEQVIEIIAQDPKPILIDEADYLISNDKIELVREINDETSCPIILMGEGQLSSKLKKFERVHNRVLKWEVAERASIEDTQELALLYAAGLDFSDDLINALNVQSDGITRRIVTNIYNIKSLAASHGFGSLDLKKFLSIGDFLPLVAPIGGRA